MHAQIQGQTEIQQFRLEVRTHQDIGRLQVAVQHSMLVQKLHREHHFVHQFGPLFEGQVGGGERERRALQVLHHEVRRFLRGTQAVDARDVRMAQARHGAGFGHKAGAQQGLVGIPPGQRLDGYLATQSIVERQPHAAHSAGADLAHHLVPAEPLRRGRRSIFEHAIDLAERGQLWLEFRVPGPRGFAILATVQGFRQRIGQLLFVLVFAAHCGASQMARNRFTARYTSSATASRDLPSRSAISAVESPSIRAMRMACR